VGAGLALDRREWNGVVESQMKLQIKSSTHKKGGVVIECVIMYAYDNTGFGSRWRTNG
jgi:hypothetical protein